MIERNASWIIEATEKPYQPSNDIKYEMERRNTNEM